MPLRSRNFCLAATTFPCPRCEPAILCLRHRARRDPADRAGCAAFSPVRCAVASGVSLRDCRKPAPPAPASHARPRFSGHCKRLLSGRSLVAQRAGNESRDRIHDHRCAQLAAAQDVISDREFAIGQVLSHSFVDAFVAAADQDNPFQRGQFLCHALMETRALSRQQHHTLFRAVRLRPTRNAMRAGLDFQVLNTLKDRFRLQHHAFAAAEWAVIHGPVPVMRKSPQVVDFDRRQARFPRPADNAVIQRSAKKIRKDRQNVDLHRGNLNVCRNPCGGGRLARPAPAARPKKGSGFAQDDSFLLHILCCSFSSAVSGAFTSSMPSGNFMQIFLCSISVLARYASA